MALRLRMVLRNNAQSVVESLGSVLSMIDSFEIKDESNDMSRPLAECVLRDVPGTFVDQFSSISRPTLLWDANIRFAQRCSQLHTTTQTLRCDFADDTYCLETRWHIPSTSKSCCETCRLEALDNSRCAMSLEYHSQDEIKWFKEYSLWKTCISPLTIAKGLALIDKRAFRLEPYYYLASFFIDQKMLHAAWPFIDRGYKCLDANSWDTLHIETKTYFPFLAMAFATACNLNKPDIALRAGNALLLQCASLTDAVDKIQKALVGFVRKLPQLSCEKLCCPNLQPGWFLLNPSCCVLDDKLVLNVRMTNADARFLVLDANNARVPCSVQHPFLTCNARFMEDKWTEFKCKEVLPRFGGVFRGLEDCRLFVFREKLWFLATSQEYSETHKNVMILGNDHNLVRLQSPNPQRNEKNWLPFEHEGLLLLLYSFSPLVVLVANSVTGQTQPFRFRKTKLPNFRGSAGPVVLNDSYVFVVHEVWPNRKYVHRFVQIHKRSFDILAVSMPFVLSGNHNVEYVAGCCKCGNEYVLTWGENDENAMMSLISAQTLSASLKDE
jgi:hypothetical protein